MKIEMITSKTFIHTQNTMRDSDGHGHPGPETKGKKVRSHNQDRLRS